MAHYRDQRPELDRLAGPQGRIELARTQEILSKHLSPAPQRVLDVGGAVGTYAAWLASQGHLVQHRNSTNRPGWFTTAFFHHPSELVAEAEEAGLHVRQVVGLEGLAGWLPSLADRWSDATARERILYAARAIDDEPSLLGLSAHLLLTAERPSC